MTTPATPSSGFADFIEKLMPTSTFFTVTSLWRTFALLAFLFVLKYLQDRSNRARRAASLQIHAAKKFKERNLKRQVMHEMIHRDYKLPDAERRVFLLSLTASELHHHMHVKRDVTSTEVVLLYSLRAMAIGAITNAVTEEFYTDALEEAKKVDQRIAARKEGSDKSTPGLLEGIPVSVKDAFDQKGADTTCGFAVRCFKPHSEDGLIVRLLRDAGAILYVRTNIPQGLMVPRVDEHHLGYHVQPVESRSHPRWKLGRRRCTPGSQGKRPGSGKRYRWKSQNSICVLWDCTPSSRLHSVSRSMVWPFHASEVTKPPFALSLGQWLTASTTWRE